MQAARQRVLTPPVRRFTKSGGGTTRGRGFGRLYSRRNRRYGKRLTRPWSLTAEWVLVKSMLTTSWEDWGVITRLHDPNDYSGTVAHYFEAFLKTANPSIAARARLYNITLAGPIAGSVVATPSTTAVRLRSSGFSLPVGDNEYKAQIGQ